MEEPYLSIQSIGTAAEKLAADTTASPEQQFAQVQLQLNKLADLKFEQHSLPVDWEQYIAQIETTLHRIQAEARPQISREEAIQIGLATRAKLSRDKVIHDEDALEARWERKQTLKTRSLTLIAAIIILLFIGALCFYQWRIFSSNEGWFHDVSQKRWSVIEKRMAFGKAVDTKDHSGMTALLYLARTGTLADIQTMFELGADLHAVDNQGLGALHYAAAATNVDAVDWLIEQGIDPNAADNTGTTPLHYLFIKAPGTSFGLQTYDLLLRRGAKTDTANDKESILMAAVDWVRGGAFDEKPAAILKELIERGADVNYRGINNSSALNNALAKYLPSTPDPKILLDSDPVVRLLVENGATSEDESLSLSEDIENIGTGRIEFLRGLQ